MVSVIIPCYNHGVFIRETIDSVKAQIYSDWEIIIVNDGSSDDYTIKVLTEIANEGINVINISNVGVSTARNIGIEASKGEFILPLDADDKIGPSYLQDAVQILSTKHEVKLVYCGCEYFGELVGRLDIPDFSIEGMLLQNLIFNAAVFRKRDFVVSGGYDPAFVTGWEDWEFWLRFIKSNDEVYKLPGTHFFYRIKQLSRNALLQGDKLKIAEQQLFKKHVDKYLRNYSYPISLIREHEFIKKEFENLEGFKAKIQGSLSYLLGHLLLFPLKEVRRVFKK